MLRIEGGGKCYRNKRDAWNKGVGSCERSAQSKASCWRAEADLPPKRRDPFETTLCGLRLTYTIIKTTPPSKNTNWYKLVTCMAAIMYDRATEGASS